jgi:hypothetical protein
MQDNAPLVPLISPSIEDAPLITVQLYSADLARLKLLT